MPKLAVLGAVFAVLTCTAAPASAHPAPFTYLDIRVADRGLDVSLIAHAFDVAHDTGLARPEQLMEAAVLQERGRRFAELLPARLTIEVDGRILTLDPWTVVEALPERQSIRLTTQAGVSSPPGVIKLTTHLFPYDTAHQTFVNFYDRGAISSQSILDAFSTETTYYAGTTAGGWAAVRLALPQAVTHLLTGLEHIAIIVGLLLLGGSRRQTMVIALAFTAGHLLTSSVAAFNIVSPPDRLIDPALALAVVYIGADNLMAAGGRDVRGWMAVVIGGIHGFGFAALLRFLGLSRPALMWSIGAVNVGVGFASVLLALIVAAAIRALARRGPQAARRLVLSGSIAVMTIGVAWFVQRVFFPAFTAFPI